MVYACIALVHLVKFLIRRSSSHNTLSFFIFCGVVILELAVYRRHLLAVCFSLFSICFNNYFSRPGLTLSLFLAIIEVFLRGTKGEDLPSVIFIIQILFLRFKVFVNFVVLLILLLGIFIFVSSTDGSITSATYGDRLKPHFLLTLQLLFLLLNCCVFHFQMCKLLLANLRRLLIYFV